MSKQSTTPAPSRQPMPDAEPVVRELPRPDLPPREADAVKGGILKGGGDPGRRAE